MVNLARPTRMRSASIAKHHAAEILGDGGAEDQILEIGPLADLAARGAQARLQLRRRIGAATAQAPLQFPQGGRRQEDRH